MALLKMPSSQKTEKRGNGLGGKGNGSKCTPAPSWTPCRRKTPLGCCWAHLPDVNLNPGSEVSIPECTEILACALVCELLLVTRGSCAGAGPQLTPRPSCTHLRAHLWGADGEMAPSGPGGVCSVLHCGREPGVGRPRCWECPQLLPFTGMGHQC